MGLEKIDICITTIERPRALERMLLSIASHCPDASIHIADQSETIEPESYDRLGEQLDSAGLQSRPTVHRLPFDCGVSVARNHLVDSTAGEYKLVVDDDGVFTADTAIERMAQLLDAHPRVGIVGGGVMRDGQVRHVGAELQRRGAVLHELEASQPFGEHDGIRFREVGFLPNFALIRRELFEHIRWDPELKIGGEHLDFYLRLPRTPFIAVMTPDVSGEHAPAERDRDYMRLRLRGDFLKAMMVKHGLRRIEHRGGMVSELLPTGRLIRVRPGETHTAAQAGS